MKYCFFIIILFINIICIRKKELFISDIKSQFEQFNIDNKKNYPLVTLGYITPWNKEGYEYVKKYSEKFDIISPTWFELKPEEIDGEFQIILDGSNNVDSSFMKDLKNKNKKILILPRLHVGFNEQKLFNIWFTKESDQFVKVLERRIKYNKFDGYVFDCMKIWYDVNLLNKFTRYLLPKISEVMKKLNKKFILTVIPVHRKNMNYQNDKDILKKLKNYVDYFNIMTYDYDQYDNDNNKFYSSPITWIKETIDFYAEKDNDVLKKILFGVPFHGYVYNKKSGKPIDVINSKQFLQLLNEGEYEINFDENEYEYTISDDKNIINFPNINYIGKRLELSKELNIGGCGIWDIGNGKEGLLEPL